MSLCLKILLTVFDLKFQRKFGFTKYIYIDVGTAGEQVELGVSTSGVGGSIAVSSVCDVLSVFQGFRPGSFKSPPPVQIHVLWADRCLSNVCSVSVCETAP